MNFSITGTTTMKSKISFLCLLSWQFTTNSTKILWITLKKEIRNWLSWSRRASIKEKITEEVIPVWIALVGLKKRNLKPNKTLLYRRLSLVWVGIGTNHLQNLKRKEVAVKVHIKTDILIFSWLKVIIIVFKTIEWLIDSFIKNKNNIYQQICFIQSAEGC